MTDRFFSLLLFLYLHLAPLAQNEFSIGNSFLRHSLLIIKKWFGGSGYFSQFNQRFIALLIKMRWLKELCIESDDFYSSSLKQHFQQLFFTALQNALLRSERRKKRCRKFWNSHHITVSHEELYAHVKIVHTFINLLASFEHTEKKALKHSAEGEIITGNKQ